jgi:cell division protein FtsQ
MKAERARGPEVRRARAAGAAVAAPRLGREPARLVTDARLRRPSMLPRRLVWGRLVRGAALLGVSGLAALGVLHVAGWVERSDALPVRTVAVQGASEGAPVEEILAYAGVEPGAPLFAVDLEGVAARVLEHPYVAQATVRRVPPDGIEVSVETRVPRAVLAPSALDAGGLYLLDAGGRVMKSARVGDGLDLPVVTGFAAADIASGAASEALAAAVSLAEAHAGAGAPGGAASEVHLVPGVGFELVLEDGTRVRVGDDGPEVMKAKLARLDAVVRRLSQEGRRASFIYLDDERRPERAAVRLRPMAETPPVGG